MSNVTVDIIQVVCLCIKCLFFRNIDITDLQTDKKFSFILGRWLAVDIEDGKIECLSYVASDYDLKEFDYLFIKKSTRDMADRHIWYSIYARPPVSPFTRCQRLSVAISFLLSVMVANIIFYGRIPESAENENKIGGFSFTLQQVNDLLKFFCKNIC